MVWRIAVAGCWSLAAAARAEESAGVPQPRWRVADLARAESVRDLAQYTEPRGLPRAWKISVIAVLASQAADAASSYGMPELNPVLAGPSGRFGARAVGIKLGATAAILGLEYLLVKKRPGAARVLTRLNWSGAAVTSGLAAYNFSAR